MSRNKFAVSGILGAVAALALTSAASAADLPRRSEPAFVQPVPIFTWTGFYIGASAGYAFGDAKSTFNGFAPGFLGGGSYNSLGDGFIIGGTVGYNFQVSPMFVVGVEADLSYLDVGKTVSNGFVTVSQDMTYFGTVRGRLGVTFDRFMVYGTGGLAFANVESTTSIAGLGSFYSGKNDDTRFGYTVGAGVEYAFTNNLSAKVEYLYYDLDNKNYNSTLVGGGGFGPGFATGTRSEARGSIVRGGINYRF